MKKMLCVSAAASLIAALAIGVGAADEKIILTPSATTVSAGDTLTVTIAVNTEEANTFLFYDPVYDPEYLEWTGGEWLLGSETMSDYVTESIPSDSGEQGRSGVYYSENATQTGSVEIATMEFTVLKESDTAQTIGCSVIAKNNETVVLDSSAETDVTLGEEEPVVEYTFGQSAQIKLIEPWGLKANARVTNVTVDYASLYDFGAYFIRASDLDTTGLTQTTITAGDILNDPDAVKYTKADTEHVSVVKINGNENMSVIYDRDLYTYEFSDSIFVMFYMVTKEGSDPVYFPIRERNLSQLVNTRMSDTSGAYTDKEKAVYAYMAELEQNITDYRSDFTTLTSPVMQDVPTLAEYSINGGTLAESSSYTYGHTVQIKLIEPWGMKLNGRINNAAVDYASMAEYGVIVLPDNSDTEYSASEMLARSDAYVFSSTNGDASIITLNGNKNISAEFFKNIYTYQLDSNVHVMFYVVDTDGNIHCGPDKIRNLRDLMETRSAPDVAGYTDKEKAVYASMVNLYEAVTDYRSDYIN